MRLTPIQIEAKKRELVSGLIKNPERQTRSLQRGFTLTELITVMVILGILAAVAAPRFFDRNVFDSRGFYDQVISTLRYAQKAAIAQRRFVCVAFTSNSVTLTYDATAPSTIHTAATCPGANLTGPTGTAPYSVSSSNASFTATPAAFSFDALGRPSAAQSITVSGYATPILIEAETGYVH
ncbi:MAG: prepilin-type N-terminal cleavage/methylation domain-containing protein [Gallionellaceae bacterium]|nr:prepilin-type N-terminal cleavage/methylation domain-containing protein [Gallionellaceae bacterium]